MPRRLMLFCLSLSPFLTAGRCFPAEFTPASRVTEVTVYRATALVTREARLAVPPGTHLVSLKDIPCMADPDSVRVSGSGSTRVEIGGIEVREEFRQPSLTPEYRQTDAEIRKIARRAALLDDRAQSIALLREFIAGLKSATAQSPGKDVPAPGGLPVASWGKAFDFFSARLDALSREQRTIETERSDLHQRAGVARGRLAQMVSQDATRRWNAIVHVTAASTSEVSLKISYLATNASWQPLYDARLDPAAGTVTLKSYGQVIQSTGEDWMNVPLALATSVPSAGIDLPVLASLALRLNNIVTLVDGVATATTFNSEYVDALPILARNYRDVLTFAPGVSDKDGDGNATIHGSRDTDVIGLGAKSREMPAAMPQAVEARSEVAVRYTLPGRYDVPSDGQSHRHLIASRELDARVEHRAIPRLNPAAFLVATVHLPSETPILAGKVQHFVGDDLVGTSAMPQRSAGEDVAISFGPDDRLRVGRKQTLKTIERHGKAEDTLYRFQTTLESHLLRDEIVEVKDRIPVSQDERIVVDLDDETTPGVITDAKEPGILTWKIPLGRGETKDIVLSYRVRSPRGASLASLD